MNPRATFQAVLLISCVHQSALAEGAMRDITSVEQMDAKVRANRSSQAMPGQAVTDKPREINKVPDSLLASSQMLSANGQWTLVPKSAVLFVPPEHQARVVTTPAGTLVGWQEFLTANRGWLTSYEVSMSQASGQDGLKPDIRKTWANQRKVVVATHQGGAISFKTTETPKP